MPLPCGDHPARLVITGSSAIRRNDGPLAPVGWTLCVCPLRACLTLERARTEYDDPRDVATFTRLAEALSAASAAPSPDPSASRP
jgi:hypothetical protein